MLSQGTYDGGSNKNKGRQGQDFKGKSYAGRKPVSGEHSDRGNRFSKPNGASGGGKFSNNRPDRNKGYSSAPKFSSKDDDEEDNGRRSKSFRPKESKPSVSIPDKNKTMMRLEKEQKGIKKKQQSKKKESSRPQPKVKRANNVNYTREYANGAYDDYDDYYDDF